jgi:hypothetical protein
VFSQGGFHAGKPIPVLAAHRRLSFWRIVRVSQVSAPDLSNQVLSEAVVWFFFQQFESRRLIDAPGGGKYIVGP